MIAYYGKDTIAEGNSLSHLWWMDEKLIRLGLLEDEDLQLDLAALALAGADHPGLDLADYERTLQAIAERVADVGPATSSGAERAACLFQVLGREYGFAGDRKNYDDSDNADLVRIIDRRRGLPIGLSILHVAAARRVGWVAEVLDVPGHALVLVGDEAAPVVIDPFNGGTVVDAPTIAAILDRNPDGSASGVHQISTMPNQAILIRLLLNQASRAENAGKGRRALTLYQRMTAFAPAHPNGWWHRARLELADGDVAAARASLSSMLETTRDPAVRTMVSDTMKGLANS